MPYVYVSVRQYLTFRRFASCCQSCVHIGADIRWCFSISSTSHLCRMESAAAYGIRLPVSESQSVGIGVVSHSRNSFSIWSLHAR